MKKQLISVLGLAILATPAFASKARLLALGEDIYGSFYVNDNRNVFYNAAQVNNHKDYVTFEWGNTTAAAETNASPKAEGGFFKTHGALVYGVQLGSESVSSAGFRGASGVTIQESNNIDLFVGGDAGVKWGANLTYSKTAKDESNNDQKQEAMRSRLGVIAGDLEGFANINLSNKAESGTGPAAAEFKGKLGYQVGAIYNLNDYKVFADYRTLKGEASGALDGDISSSQLQVGVGRSNKLNDKTTLFTKAQFQMVNAKNETNTLVTGDFANEWDSNGPAPGGVEVACGLSTAIFCEEYKGSLVPVTIGLEHEATSWLALRGSISQTVWGTEEDANDERSFAASTKVNAGASLKFGEMSIDGLIGSGAGNSTDAGVVNTDNLMSRVSMTYKF